jgi:lysozyme-like protein
VPTLSDTQIATVARNAGFTGGNVATAVAVGLAESGGQTDVTHVNSDGSTDYGVWQINSVHTTVLASGSWANPSDNARMAFTVSGGTNWQPWSTYNSGAYLAYLARARVAAAMPDAPVDASTVASTKKHGKPPPYATVPKAPFSKAQRLAIVEWCHYMGTQTVGPGHDDEDFNKLNDVQLGLAYRTYLNMYANSGGPANSTIKLPGEDVLNSMVQLLRFISDPHNWLRVGFFVIGLILVIIAGSNITGTTNAVTNAAKAYVKVK